MGKKKFGFELLIDQACDFIFSDMEMLASEVKGDSKIEELLYHAVQLRIRLGATEMTQLIPVDSESEEVRVTSLMRTMDHARTALIVRPQAQIGGDNPRRVDFLFFALDWRGDREMWHWRKLIVECDGHDFHERTKEQAARDRSRDRRAVHEGVDCFRFTGSEIWRDPWGCAEELTNWAAKRWP